MLGEADLNLSDYLENEYKILKLPLRKCGDPDAYIEIGLRGTLAVEKTTPKARGEAGSESGKDQLMVLL